MNSQANTHSEEGILEKNIFTKFTVKFCQPHLNINFNEVNFPSILLFFVLAGGNLLYSIAMVITYYYFRTDKNTFIEIATNSVLSLSGFLFVFLFGIYCFTKKKITLSLVLITGIYVLFSLNHILTKCQLKFPQIDYAYIFLFTDVLFKFIWVLFLWNEFIFIFFANIITLVLILGIFFFQGGMVFQKEAFQHFPLYGAFYVMLTLVSFKLCKCSKIIFYFQTFNGQTSKVSPYQADIWDQLNCGYIRLSMNSNRNYLSDGTIKVDYLSKFFEKEKEFFAETDNEEINSPPIRQISKIRDKEMLSQILSDLTEVNNFLAVEELEINSRNTSNMKPRGSFTDSNHFLLKKGSTETIKLMQCNSITNLTIIHQLMKRKNQLHKFNYIGKKLISKDEGKKFLVLEIYARIKDNICELLFNDITKLHLYNGLQRFIIQSGQYLHDFKNPLICINDDMNELKIHNDYIYNILLNQLNTETSKNEMMDTYFATTEKFEYLIKMSEYCRGMIASYEDFSKFIFKPREVKLSIEKIELEEVFSFVDNMMKYKIFKSKKNVEFLLIPNTCDGKVICNDKVKLKQVLINILSNSEKFTSRGSITLIANEEVINEKKYIKFLIKDTGIGMSKIVIDSLCTPFYSLNCKNLNKEGCGLGLLIVKQLTEKLGIGLKISSTPGDGTQMWFYAQDFGEGEVSPQNEETNQNQINLCIKNNSFRLTKAINTGDSDNQISNENNIIPKVTFSNDLRPPSLFPGIKNSTIYEHDSENNAIDTLTFPCDHVDKKYSEKSLPNIDKPIVKSLIGGLKVQEQTFFEMKLMTQSSYGKSPDPREKKGSLFFTSPIVPKNTKSDCPEDFEISQTKIIFRFDLKTLQVSHIDSFSYKPHIFSPSRKAFQISSPDYGGKKGESIRKIKSHLSMKMCNLSNFETILKSPQETSNNDSDISKQFLMEHQEGSEAFLKKRRLSSMKSITNFGFHPKSTIGSFNEYLNQQSNEGLKEEFLRDMGSIIINVLIVDDDDKIRSCTKKIFQKIEKNEKKDMFRIDEADDGFVGLIKIIEKNLNHSEKYDIIIIDDEMNYLNGTDLFKILLYITENKFGAKSNFDMNIISRIIICSGDPKLVKNKVKISEDAIFSKPLTQNFMSAYVRKIFEE